MSHALVTDTLDRVAVAAPIGKKRIEDGFIAVDFTGHFPGAHCALRSDAGGKSDDRLAPPGTCP